MKKNLEMISKDNSIKIIEKMDNIMPLNISFLLLNIIYKSCILYIILRLKPKGIVAFKITI